MVNVGGFSDMFMPIFFYTNAVAYFSIKEKQN